MQKYLTQHSLNAFTIQLPSKVVSDIQGDLFIDKEPKTSPQSMLFGHFIKFLHIHRDKRFEHLPKFNFLSIFYDVQVSARSNEFVEFELILNKEMNKSMWLRLKHAIFNQYNALIGFSEVLKEVEELDDTDRLLIQKININARDIYKSTRLLMEFERLKDWDFELKIRLAPPHEFLTAYLNHRKAQAENILIDSIPTELINCAVNMDHEFYRTSLDLLLDIITEFFDLEDIKFYLKVEKFCQFRLECDFETISDPVFFQELQSVNEFFDQGTDLIHINNRMFHLLYIRLVAEKLGGSFRIDVSTDSNKILSSEWIFPLVEYEFSTQEYTESSWPQKSIPDKSEESEIKESYSAELRSEVLHFFSYVNGNFVLDEWKTIADNLDLLCMKYNVDKNSSLRQIIQKIRDAVDSFDIMELKRLGKKIKQIGFDE